MTGTALITGASAGIGEALARVHAAQGGNLVIAARRVDRLEEIAAQLRDEYGVDVKVMPVDLAKPRAAKRLAEQIDAAGLELDVLINNAGFGGHGCFHSSDLRREQRMMQVNMVALTELTYHVVQGMVERGRGRVLNVGSIAGFLPGPLQAVYFASKAYVNSFSQAIAAELKGTGVTVTVLCPGPVKTEFQHTADMDGVPGFDFAADADSVAKIGYRAMQRGELLVLNERKLRLFVDGVLPFIPRKPLLWMSRKSMEKTR